MTPIAHYRSETGGGSIASMDDPSQRDDPNALPEDVQALGIWLDRIRASSGISVKGLANEVGVDRTAMRRWLRGDHEPSALALLRMFDALGVTLSHAPHGHFAQTAGGAIRAVRREFLGPEISRETAAALHSRISQAADPRAERVKIAAELGVAADDLDDVLWGRPEGGRLGELEATVEAQGKSMTEALKSLAAGIRKLERRLAAEAPPAKQEQTR